MHVGLAEIDRGRIEPQQHMGAGGVKIADLINLVVERD